MRMGFKEQKCNAISSQEYAMKSEKDVFAYTSKNRLSSFFKMKLYCDANFICLLGVFYKYLNY